MNEGFYQGAGLNIGQAAHGTLRARQVSAFAGSDVQRAAMSGADATGGLVDSMQKLQDYRDGAEAMRQLREISARHEGKLKAGLEAAPGSKLSLYRENGEIDEEKMEALLMQAKDEMDKVRPSFWSAERLARYEQEYADFEATSKVHVAGMVQQHQLAGIRRAGRAALEEAEQTGNERAFTTELGNQVDAGLLMQREADNLLRRFRVEQERKRLAAAKAAARTAPEYAADMQHEELMKMREPGGLQTEEDGQSAGSAAGNDELTLKPVGQNVLMNAEIREEVLDSLEELQGQGALTMGGGHVKFELSGVPSDVSVWQEAQAAQGEYTLEQHRKDLMLVAAEVQSKPEYAGLSAARRREMIVQRAALRGGADLFFNGDKDAYNGWLAQNAELVEGYADVVKASDRMLVGVPGQKGINELLPREVTDAEIRAVWNEETLYDEKTPGFEKAKEATYWTFRNAWAADTGAKHKPGLDDDDVKAFFEWYMKPKGLHDQRRVAFAKGVRKVFRQRAIDAVLNLRSTGTYVLRNGTRVQLDGTGDWAVEQRVIRDVLSAPVTKDEHGTLAALAEREAMMKVARDARAAEYARKAKEVKEKLQKVADKEREIDEAAVLLKEQEEQRKKEYEALREKSAKALQAHLTRGTAVTARWNGVKEDQGTAPRVSMPVEAYEAVAAGLGATKGFFVVLPGSSVPVPVEARKGAKGVEFNRACFPLMKRGKLTEAEARKLVNGANIKMKFTTDSTSYDF